MSRRVAKGIAALLGALAALCIGKFTVMVVQLCQFRETSRASAHYIEQVLSYDWVGPTRREQLLRDLEIGRGRVSEMDAELEVCDMIVPMLPKATPHWWTIGGMNPGPPSAGPVAPEPPPGPETPAPTLPAP